MLRRTQGTGLFLWRLILLMTATLWFAGWVPVAAARRSSGAWPAGHRGPPAQAAAGDEVTCWSLDMMLLIDQSRSMFAGDASDPDGYRFLAAEDVLDRLIFSGLDQCSEAVHRFGLITFGDRADKILPLVSLDLDENDDPQLWTEPLRARIDEAAQDTTQQGTDFLQAFEAAAELFEEAESVDGAEPDAQRRRVVVLLTDGSPAGIRGSVPDYMCDLRDYLNGPSWEGYSIWVVALSASQSYLDNPGCGGTIRHNWEDIAESHRGRLLGLPYNEQLIPAFLNDIVDTEFGRRGERLGCGEVFYLDPYLQQVTFTFYRRGQDVSVTLARLDETSSEPLYTVRGPGEEEIMRPEEAPGVDFREDLYVSSSYKEQFVLDLPPPGPWQFYVEDLAMEECQRRVEGRMTPRVAGVRLLEPVHVLERVPDPPYYDRTEEPARFVVELQTEAGALVAPEADYPLEVTVDWQLPSGAETMPDGTVIQPVSLYPEPEGRWTSVEPVVAPEEGVYSFTVVGTALRGDRSSEFTVFTRTATYEVRDVRRLAFAVEAPQAAQSLLCNEVIDCTPVALPLPVRVRLLDETGQQLDGKDRITTDLNQAFRATWLEADGRMLGATTLTASSEEPGLFEGVLRVEGSETLGCGETEVAVSFVGSYDAEHFTMPVTSLRVPLTRSRLQGVMIEASQPQEGARVPLHRNFRCACRGEVQPVSLVLKLTDCSGTPIDPSEIVSGTPESLCEVRLVGPSSLDARTIRLEQVVLDGSPVLRATAELAGMEPGSYGFEVLQVGELPVGYVLAQGGMPHVEFELRDTPLTNPTTCQTLKWGTIGIIVIAGCILLYLATGSLHGAVLVFITQRDYSYVEGGRTEGD